MNKSAESDEENLDEKGGGEEEEETRRRAKVKRQMAEKGARRVPVSFKGGDSDGHGERSDLSPCFFLNLTPTPNSAKEKVRGWLAGWSRNYLVQSSSHLESLLFFLASALLC